MYLGITDIVSMTKCQMKAPIPSDKRSQERLWINLKAVKIMASVLLPMHHSSHHHQKRETVKNIS
jgi:hypothetical protein